MISQYLNLVLFILTGASLSAFIIYNNYHTFAVHYPGFEELWDVEDNAEEEDRDEVEADSLADRAGLCDVPVGVGMADSAVPSKMSFRSPAFIRWITFIYFRID